MESNLDKSLMDHLLLLSSPLYSPIISLLTLPKGRVPRAKNWHPPRFCQSPFPKSLHNSSLHLYLLSSWFSCTLPFCLLRYYPYHTDNRGPSSVKRRLYVPFRLSYPHPPSLSLRSFPSSSNRFGQVVHSSFSTPKPWSLVTT